MALLTQAVNQHGNALILDTNTGCTTAITPSGTQLKTSTPNESAVLNNGLRWNHYRASLIHRSRVEHKANPSDSLEHNNCPWCGITPVTWRYSQIDKQYLLTAYDYDHMCSERKAWITKYPAITNAIQPNGTNNPIEPIAQPHTTNPKVSDSDYAAQKYADDKAIANVMNDSSPISPIDIWLDDVTDDHSTPHVDLRQDAKAPYSAPVQVTANELRPLVSELIADSVVSISTLTVNGARNQIELLAESAIQRRLPVEHVVTIKTEKLTYTVSKRQHRLFPLICAIVTKRIPVYLAGPAGSGKTTIAIEIARLLNLNPIVKPMSSSDDATTLLGYVSPVNGNYYAGVLYEPYANGGVLLLDELDAADGNAVTCLNAALANGSITFPNNETVYQHKDFIILAGGNTLGNGGNSRYKRNALDAATMDRFAIVEFPYDEAAELEWFGGVNTPTDYIDIAPDTYTKATHETWVRFVQAVRHAVTQHDMPYTVTPRASKFGIDCMDTISTKLLADIFVFRGMTADDRKRVLHTLAQDATTARHLSTIGVN